MEIYRDLYLKMFNAVTNVIEELQKLQVEVEELYINCCNNPNNEESVS